MLNVAVTISYAFLIELGFQFNLYMHVERTNQLVSAIYIVDST